MKFHELETAWAAGFFDGEGCVQAYQRNYILETKLTIFSNDPRPLRRLVTSFGGTIKSDYRGVGWWWTISGKDSEIFAQAILRHTSVKYDQLELYIELRQTVGNGGRVSELDARRRVTLIGGIKDGKKVTLP